MKKELAVAGTFVATTLTAVAGPHHGGWGHHGGWWGHGGCHFWPGFIGGAVGGLVSGAVWGSPRVVVGTPVVSAAPVVIGTPVVQTQPIVVQQPVQAQANVQSVSMPANNTVVSQKDETIVYIDTNNYQRIEGKVLFDSKGNKMLPSSYRVIRVDDLQRQ